jgi:hypothetical protein
MYKKQMLIMTSILLLSTAPVLGQEYWEEEATTLSTDLSEAALNNREMTTDVDQFKDTGSVLKEDDSIVFERKDIARDELSDESTAELDEYESNLE